MKQQNTKKRSNKTVARLAIASILGVFVCIMCVCATTYAWFTGSVRGDNNNIQTAEHCLMSVSVAQGGEERAIVEEDSPATLSCVGTYDVTLELPKESASGYLVLTANGTEYYTAYIQRSDEAAQSLSFTLDVKTEQDVTFKVRWGTHSTDVAVQNGETLTIA